MTKVGALAGIFDHRVAGIVDDVGVVAAAALHGVGAALAFDVVRGDIAGQDVGEAVAGGVDRGRSRSASDSRHWRRASTRRREDGVVSLPCRFDNNIP